MEHSYIEDFNKEKDFITKEFKTLCIDNYNDIIDTNGKSLNDHPIIISLNLSKYINPMIRKIALKYEDLFEKDAELLQIEEIVLIATTFSALYDNASMALNKVKEKFKSSLSFLNEQELNDEFNLLLNNSTEASFLKYIQDENEIFQIVSKSLCANATLDYFEKNPISSNDIISIEDLSQIDPKVAYHVQKTALDQVCSNIFKTYDHNYDSLTYITRIDKNDEINSLSSIKIQDNQLAFVFVNAKSMDSISFPKFIELLDYKTGKSCYVTDVVQDQKELIIPCNINNMNINVKTKLTKGVILTEFLQ